MNTSLAAAILGLSLSGGIQQQKPAQTDTQHQGVVERGDHAMGFSHDKTAHHFPLYADGGAIEANARDAQDTAIRDAIRSHFAHRQTVRGGRF
jgi:tRNA A37 threonylcarbamoyltransferase TsaD